MLFILSERALDRCSQRHSLSKRAKLFNQGASQGGGSHRISIWKMDLEDRAENAIFQE